MRQRAQGERHSLAWQPAAPSLHQTCIAFRALQQSPALPSLVSAAQVDGMPIMGSAPIRSDRRLVVTNQEGDFAWAAMR